MMIHLLVVNDGLMNGLMDPVPARYAIRVNGHLGATTLSAFPALVPRLHGTDTVLTGLLDRSALYGVLAQVEARRPRGLVEVRQLGRSPATVTSSRR